MKGTKKRAYESKLGESYLEYEKVRGEYPDPSHKVYKPSTHNLANPPAEVKTACVAFGHYPATFWCYFHGEFCIKWELRAGKAVDWSTCQCPQCINNNMFYTGDTQI